MSGHERKDLPGPLRSKQEALDDLLMRARARLERIRRRGDWIFAAVLIAVGVGLFGFVVLYIEAPKRPSKTTDPVIHGKVVCRWQADKLGCEVSDPDVWFDPRYSK